MLTLFHSPRSRSTAVLTLIEEMGLANEVTLREVTIPRQDGTGARDPLNPHPEGKVPALVHDDQVITERAAIMLHLCALFPDRALTPPPGSPAHGACLGWMHWYGGVMEPVLVHAWTGIDHPVLQATFRGPDEVAARLHAALARGPWLTGASYTVADLLCHSPYAWFPEATPDDPLIRDWVARCQARPATTAVRTREGEPRRAA